MKSAGIIPIILQPDTGDPAIILSQFRHRCIFHFNPFLKTANPQLAYVNSSLPAAASKSIQPY